MKINNLFFHNLKNVSCALGTDFSLGIGGLSGSGKTSFCTAVYRETLFRIITLLPKSEYRFLFSKDIKSNFSSANMRDLPLTFFLVRLATSNNPRSTLGTQSGLFKLVRIHFAAVHKKAPEFFSFNNSISWCPQCKGRGSTAGTICKECNGDRYRHEVLEFRINVGKQQLNIVDVHKMQIHELEQIAPDLGFPAAAMRILENLSILGLAYLSLDRIMSTLSGGETSRTLLAEFLANYVGSLLILDEISSGLDGSSLHTVLSTLNEHSKENQIWCIDHSDNVLDATQRDLFFGPLSGDAGGQIVSESPRPEPIYPPLDPRLELCWYVFTHLHKRNINIEELRLPANRMIAITGASGCGKSTLVNDCLVPAVARENKKLQVLTVGQNRFQSITSRSTIATFLDIQRYTAKLEDGIGKMDISTVYPLIKKNAHIRWPLAQLIDLGLGYLSLDRKIQTLSGGEFQSVHLVSSLKSLEDSEYIIFLDEPSKGLSQNILNLFMRKLRELINNYNATIIIIEHNNYVINSCDYIIDFGPLTFSPITSLPIYSNAEWQQIQKNRTNIQTNFSSSIGTSKTGIVKIETNVDKEFEKYKNNFCGGILKNFSATAEWIYGDYNTDMVSPVIVVDFEKLLYSKHSFLFEVGRTINYILNQAETSVSELYDFFNPENLCKSCRGNGTIEVFDFDLVLDKITSNIWNGMLKNEVMARLKNYNYTKIKSLFSAIKKASKYDLEKPWDKMSDEEKKILLYGYWQEEFYDSSKKNWRNWKGLIPLIRKYMRPSKSKLKEAIIASITEIECPYCHGNLLNTPLEIQIRGMSLASILKSPLGELCALVDRVPQLATLMDICGEKVTLLTDVSTLPRTVQARLKCFELMEAGLINFSFALKNIGPFFESCQAFLNKLAEKNRIIMLDWDGLSETKNDILKLLEQKYHLLPGTYVYELVGLKKIATGINNIRKIYPCPYCHGSGEIREESIFEDIDVTRTPCRACHESGISDTGLSQEVNGTMVKSWLNDPIKRIIPDIDHHLSELLPMVRLRDLNKHELANIRQYQEKKHVKL